MPERYPPPYQTCHRRFQEWVRSGAFEVLLKALVQDMKERGDLDLTECFIGGTLVIAKKGAEGWEKPSGAKVQRSWQWQTALVFLRYRRRWKVERLCAWLQNYRRILVRFERFVENYIGFVHLGCLVILLRHYF